MKFYSVFPYNAPIFIFWLNRTSLQIVGTRAPTIASIPVPKTTKHDIINKDLFLHLEIFLTYFINEMLVRMNLMLPITTLKTVWKLTNEFMFWDEIVSNISCNLDEQTTNSFVLNIIDLWFIYFFADWWFVLNSVEITKEGFELKQWKSACVQHKSVLSL